MGLFVFSIWGLRVSRFLNHRAVSGSKSDTPTRAKNCECMIRKGAGKSKLKKETAGFASGYAVPRSSAGFVKTTPS
jgi:hypothetical protein